MNDESSAARIDWGVICTAAAVSLVLASNLVDIGRFRTSLTGAQEQQTESLATARRIEAQLDALAKGTQRLASNGNGNAREILAVLQQNGVQVKGAR